MNVTKVYASLEPDISDADSAVYLPSPDSSSETYSESREVIQDIIVIHRKLDICNRCEGLKPSPAVNKLFARLVGLCITKRCDSIVKAVLKDKRIKKIGPQLRSFCSMGEGLLEHNWAGLVLETGGDSFEDYKRTLCNFPYYDNYVRLAQLESNVILAYLPEPPKKIAFIGSGPIPLTSICLADRLPSTYIHNIDCEAAAIEFSKLIAEKAGYAKMSFACEYAEDGSSLTDYDVVYVAALVGGDLKTKLEVVEKVVSRMRPGALVCIRSAHSLRELLYPVFDTSEDLGAIGLEQLLMVHPLNDVVNSIFLARVLPRDEKA